MKRRVGGFFSGFLSLLLLLGIFYYRWTHVRLESPELVAQVLAEVDTNAQQSRTYSRAQNGWYELADLLYETPPALLEPFVEASELAPPEATASAMRAAVATPAASKLLRELPVAALEGALSAPVMAWAGDNLTISDYQPNFQSLRIIVRALIMLGLRHELDHQPARGLATYLGALRLASAFSGEVTLDAQIKIAGITEEPARRVLGLFLQGKLNQGDYRKAEFILQRLDLHPTGYLRVLDREMVVGWNTLDRCRLGELNLMQAGGFAKEPAAAWEKVPLFSGWYFLRQQRLLANWHMARRSALEKLEAVPGDPEQFGKDYPEDAGARLFIPRYGNSALGQRVALTRVQAVLLVARLERFRLEHKGFPARLEEIKPPARNYLAGDGKFLYRRGGPAGFGLWADKQNHYVKGE